MSDLDFEKQVRQKLNDLKLTPSADAWVNIENKLRGGNTRRTPFLWLSLLLTGMLAGGFLLLHRDTDSSIQKEILADQPLINDLKISHKNLHTTDAAIKIADTLAVAEDNLSPAGTHPYSTGQRLQDSNSTQGPAIKYRSEQVKTEKGVRSITSEKDQSNGSINSSPSKKQASIDGLRTEPASRKNRSARPLSRKEIALIRLSKAAPATDFKPDIQQEDQEVADQKIPLDEQLSLAEFQRKEKATEKIVIAPKPGVSNTKVFKPVVAVNDQLVANVAKPAAKKVKFNKWSFAGTGFAGIGAVNEGGLISFNQPNVEDVSYTADFNPIRASLPLPLKPSDISPGISFSLGGSARRELSKRFSLSAGLNYTQFNTSSRVGDRVNSSQVVNNGVSGYLYVSSYYRLDPVQNTEYKNKYHFIELPVTLHTRIGYGNKIPVYWNAGLIVSRLISSTSLHFDGTTGVYYKNDRLLNQTQVGVGTGFSFVLFNATSHPLWIGPSARSNISTILKKEVSASKHFVSLGLDVNYYFKK